jgi:hypothetical protein
VEIAFAYVLVLNPEGTYSATGKHFCLPTSYTNLSPGHPDLCDFLPQQAFEKHGLYFDTDYRVLGDAELICER